MDELRNRREAATDAGPPVGAERRGAVRVRTRLEVLVSWDETCELVRTQDLSEGGLFLRTSHPNEPGTEVALELSDVRGRPIHVAGIVVWARRETDQLGEPGMGIKFRNLDDWDRTVLAELVELALRTL